MLLNRLPSFRHLRPAAAGLMAAVLGAIVPASAASTGDVLAQSAGADCYSIGQRVAAENGGTLAKFSVSSQDGQTVCVIVVLLPGKEGERPLRATFIRPAQ